METRLRKLVACHSTPGDEGEVRALLEGWWTETGLEVERHGAYAISATLPRTKVAAKAATEQVLLICAHMDSPGYAVDRLTMECGAGETRLGLAALGAPHFEGRSAAAELKTRRGRFLGRVRRVELEDGEEDFWFETEIDLTAAGVAHGDRVCFAAHFAWDEGLVTGPFLDNRLGCLMLARMAEEMKAWQTSGRVVLGATAMEETGGFGAQVLAARVRPDRVIVLDATYEEPEQGVLLGGGPVVTLADASVQLPPAGRDKILGLLRDAGVPVQTEVYSFSGTDARAFPKAGLTAPVVPLLMPTRGNHSPCEEVDGRDFESWLWATQVLAERSWGW